MKPVEEGICIIALTLALHHEYVRAVAARMSPDTLGRAVGEARVWAGRFER
ncbi:MAG: hypothetical protein WCA85_00280 [Paraburkholderia sp.]|uniref:hypothetical protein n=1 Tax=Paraburkholderia sp. TaxID=1926495 RepID=UPI003C4CEF89